MDQQALITQCERAQRACDGVAGALEILEYTCAQTRTLIAEARQTLPLHPCPDAESPACAPIIPVEPIAAPTEHELALEVLRMMRSLLEGFPADMQVKIVKALTARTMVVVAMQMHSRPITLSA